MRTYNLELGDHKIVCATTFKAIKLVTDRVMDPMMIAQDQMMAEEMLKKGVAYETKFKMTIGNVVTLVHACHEAAGGSLSFDDIGDIVMEVGPAHVVEPVGKLLLALVAGDSKEMKPKGGSKKGGPRGNE